MTSNLRVYFSKSSVIRVDVNPIFLDLVDDFLHFKLESLLFKYPWFPMGDNTHL